MLLQVNSEGLKNMAVSHYPQMTQFLTNLILPESDDNGIGSIVVTFRAPGSTEAKTLRITLQPNTAQLEAFQVNMHNSPTTAYKMPAEYNSWFSSCFGFEVILAYLGDGLRDVLFQDLMPKPSSWLSSLSSTVLGTSDPGVHKITFADCSPFLVVSKTSLDDVSSRLPDGERMDVTKFRPNIVIEGAENPWEEDFWGRVKIGDIELTLAHNCIRCKSINIDYSTGKPGTGEAGEVLKKLQKDRRVDKGAKWSPVFGRYAYWTSKSGGQVWKVGDEVRVIQLNPERTTWSKDHALYYMLVEGTNVF